MNILYIIQNDEFGGGERGFMQLAVSLRDRFRIFVAAMPGGRFEQGLEQADIGIISVDIKRRFTFKPIRQIERIIRKHSIELVHSQGARADFFTRIAGRLAGVPHILCTIQMPVENFDIGPLRKKIYRFIDWLSERYVERFIVVADTLKRVLVEWRGIPAERVVKIYNGIELDQYRPSAKQSNLRKQWGVSSEAPLIGTIGRLVWQKGFEYLIEATPAIIKAYPQAKILFVGDGPLSDKLVALSEELKVKDHVIFTGFRSDVKEILSAIDLLAIPSLLEGFPMITLEAMAMARPIVATKIDGITEQITDGKDGILVPPRDPKSLAEAIIRVLSDKKSAEAMGLEARKKVEQEFSVERMVAETEKVYLSLMRGNRKKI